MGGGSNSPTYSYSPPPRPSTQTKELTDTPWRQEAQAFTPQYEKQLKEQMKNQFTSDRVERANLLLMGPIGAGKSSFLNSVTSICKDRLANFPQEASLTTKNFCVLDCIGLEREGHGLNVNDACYLVKGHIPRNYKFNPISPITYDDPRFIRQPKDKNKFHCVIYVIDAEALYGDIPLEVMKRIKELQSRLNELGMQRVMILTKIDLLCRKVEEDLANVYRSVKVEEMVKKASEIFQLPQNIIYPVKNYSSETAINYKLNIPILLALQTMLNFAEDYIENQGDVCLDED